MNLTANRTQNMRKPTRFFNKDASPETNSDDSDKPGPDNFPNIGINYNALSDPRDPTLVERLEDFF